LYIYVHRNYKCTYVSWSENILEHICKAVIFGVSRDRLSYTMYIYAGSV